MSRGGHWHFDLDTTIPTSCVTPLEKLLLRQLVEEDGFYEDEKAGSISLFAYDHLSSIIRVDAEDIDNFKLYYLAQPEGELRDFVKGLMSSTVWEDDAELEDIEEPFELFLMILQTIIRRNPVLSPVTVQGAYAGQESYGWTHIVTPGSVIYFGTYEWAQAKLDELHYEKLLAIMGGVWVEA